MQVLICLSIISNLFENRKKIQLNMAIKIMFSHQFPFVYQNLDH